jgi:hypothetical protein
VGLAFGLKRGLDVVRVPEMTDAILANLSVTWRELVNDVHDNSGNPTVSTGTTSIWNTDKGMTAKKTEDQLDLERPLRSSLTLDIDG